MTFLEKIKPHLFSDDFLIQQTVLHAIHDYPSFPIEWTNELLKRAFSHKESAATILMYIDNQPLNEESLQILLEHIPVMDRSIVHLAISLLNELEPELALQYKEQLEPYISKDVWTLYDLLVHGTEEEVYSEYGIALNALEQEQYHNHGPYMRAKKLAACIVKNGWVTEKEIDLVMQDQLKDKWFSYNGILHVYMIGLLKLDKYIPVLASLFDRDEDNLLEETAAALISLQSDEVVKHVSPYLNNENSIIFATSVIENIKSDLAIAALREAYRNTTVNDEQDLIIEALCHQLSAEALPEISKHMEQGVFSDLVDIEQTVYSYFSILGLEHPELESWRKAAMEQEMHYREASQEGNMVANTPIRNEKKVGRNDPCPCGSGKKYKKCCGK
ncbi:zinc chelation protein SecC [Mesobacillus campisalis]|uniref:Zinc chelation protein SecC n=1 Tax=Mesobacillus campisalis TaxID=1408103 RepID=A0A0M2SYC3_9BACI|nr:SEC-C metal-binding domain-containing protein [Mesobacillus campisalis]KKK39173.1 zinc chelation protein SecC [Mesobacillus campisalis]